MKTRLIKTDDGIPGDSAGPSWDVYAGDRLLGEITAERDYADGESSAFMGDRRMVVAAYYASVDDGSARKEFSVDAQGSAAAAKRAAREWLASTLS